MVVQKKPTRARSGAVLHHVGSTSRAWPRRNAQTSGIILMKCLSFSAHFFCCSCDSYISRRRRSTAETPERHSLVWEPADGQATRSGLVLYMPSLLTGPPGCYECRVPSSWLIVSLPLLNMVWPSRGVKLLSSGLQQEVPLPSMMCWYGYCKDLPRWVVWSGRCPFFIRKIHSLYSSTILKTEKLLLKQHNMNRWCYEILYVV